MSFPRTYAAIERALLKKVVETKMARAIVRKGLTRPFPESAAGTRMHRVGAYADTITTVSPTEAVPEPVIPLLTPIPPNAAWEPPEGSVLSEGRLVVPSTGWWDVHLGLWLSGSSPAFPVPSKPTADEVQLRAYYDAPSGNMYSIVAITAASVQAGAPLADSRLVTNLAYLEAGRTVRLAFSSANNYTYNLDGSGTKLELRAYR